MKCNKLFFLSIALTGFLSACNNAEKAATEPTLGNLIPKPVSVSPAGNQFFELTGKTAIQVTGGSMEAERIGKYLAEKLAPATGFTLAVSNATASPTEGIFLNLVLDDKSIADQGYELSVTDKLVTVKASSGAGLFYGVQTLRQLFPASIESASKATDSWKIAAGVIKDQPSYGLRGSMLDVARHFFSVSDVKRYLDLMSFYKMNVLHLHLSDDQGWRIEIKSWPKLTEVGGSTQVGGGKGGFYTQEEYKEIIQYAAERYITIIPEIDMPGHTNAALASYAELNCNDSATKLYTGIEVGFSTLCTKKEVTYKFLDDVIRELSTITPGPFIHIGGDESHATKKEDYIPFMNRVQQIVKKYNKQVIGWDEIANATMIPGSVAQFWADTANSKMAVRQGAKIMMSPARKAYLDMQYDSTSKFGLHWAAYIEVDSAYIWDPATLVDGIARENIIGIEAPLWSETVSKMDEIEYLVFPRLLGYAEIGWSPAAGRNWEEYKIRLANQGPRMTKMGIDFYPSKKVPWVE